MTTDSDLSTCLHAAYDALAAFGDNLLHDEAAVKRTAAKLLAAYSALAHRQQELQHRADSSALAGT